MVVVPLCVHGSPVASRLPVPDFVRFPAPLIALKPMLVELLMNSVLPPVKVMGPPSRLPNPSSVPVTAAPLPICRVNAPLRLMPADGRVVWVASGPLKICCA